MARRSSLKEILRKSRKAILRSSILLLAVAAVMGIAYLILSLCGLGDMNALRETLGGSVWLYVAIGLLQAFQVMFIPLSNQIITIPACLVFSDSLLWVFLSSWAGIELGTIILYIIGRFGGKRTIAWILSDKGKAERCTEWLKRGRWIYPIGMLIGFIPDDILTTLAGVGRYDFWFVLGVSATTRGICCACSVWGFGYLTRYWWGWIILAIGLVLVALLTYWLFRASREREVNVSAMK